jgi:retron-type reverse transcriptase
MTSQERHEARYQRRKAERALKRKKKLTQYDNFERVADIDNLYQAFKDSMRGVVWKESVQRYEANVMRNIIETRRKLLAGEGVQSGFVEFTLRERGKIRHIKSVHISERIVQKCLCVQVLVPILSNSLIYDNGASIKGKGVSFAIRRFIAHIARWYRENNNSNTGYALLIDFSKFFDNIDHTILFELLKTKISDERIIDLTKRFITVFGEGKSLGLGSQVSQISAIFYPDKLDHYIKETLRIKYYGRYMDDLYLIHQDREYLIKCLSEIKKICDTLHITINMKKTSIIPLKNGVKFLKGIYSLTETGRIIRRADPVSRKRMRRKLNKLKILFEAGKIKYNDIYTSYQSWRGNYIKRFDAYQTIKRMDGLYNRLFIKLRKTHGLFG